MSAVNDFHNRAIDSAELAFIARRRGDDAKALALFAKALADEEAALAALDVPIQPTSAVLHRSAATIALHAGRRDDARRLAQAGLASDPPPEIAAELREVLRAAEYGFAIGATDTR